MSAPSSTLATLLKPNAPVVLDADYEMDATDRRGIDNQFQALEQAVARNLRGQVATYFKLSASSPALSPGDCFVSSPVDGPASESNEFEQVHYVTKATAASLAAAGCAAGIALTAASAGGFFRGAISGVVGSFITGLPSGTAGVVRVNPTSGRCEQVASLGTGSYGIGFVDTAGNLTLGASGLITIAAAGQGVYNVMTYGAVGNGVTDDTTAINTAIAAAVAAGRGIIYFPPGIYRILGSLTVTSASGIIFRGSGKLATSIRPEHNGDSFNFNSCDACGVETLSIDRVAGNFPTTGSGVVFNNSTRCWSLDVLMSKGYVGVYNLRSTDSTVRGLRLVQMFGSEGVRYEGDGTTTADRFNVFDLDCRNPFNFTPVRKGNWATTTAYSQGDVVVANGSFWQCQTAGTSAGSGSGPTLAAGPVATAHTTNVADNSVAWRFLGSTITWVYNLRDANQLLVSGFRSLGGSYGVRADSSAGNAPANLSGTDWYIEYPWSAGALFQRATRVEVAKYRIYAGLDDNGIAFGSTFVGTARLTQGLVERCRNSGLLINGGTDVHVTALVALDNSQAGSGAAAGISTGTGITSFKIVACRSSGALQSYGIAIGATNDAFLVEANDLTGNLTGGLNNNSKNTATQSVVRDNIGNDGDRVSKYFTGQTGSIGVSSLFAATPPKGLFRVDIYFAVTTAGSAGTVTATIGYADDIGGTIQVTSAVNLNAQNRGMFTLLVESDGSTNMTYQTTVAGAAGGPAYSVRIVATRLTNVST